MTEEKRKCGCCKQVKPLAEYYARKNGKYSWCKQCELRATALRQQSKTQHKRFKRVNLSGRDAFVAILNAIGTI